MTRLILASASPRRRELLATLYSDFACESADIDEQPRIGEPAQSYVERMAIEKAAAFSDRDALVIGADTSVVIDGDILGKPIDVEDARAMLGRLSGRSHEVMTAIAVCSGSDLASRLVITEVEFAPLGKSLIDDYLETSEPWDKAGAYGIQGFAGSFVSSLKGSYSAVVGLPLYETRQLLSERGVCPDWRTRQNDG